MAFSKTQFLVAVSFSGLTIAPAFGQATYRPATESLTQRPQAPVILEFRPIGAPAPAHQPQYIQRAPAPVRTYQSQPMSRPIPVHQPPTVRQAQPGYYSNPGSYPTQQQPAPTCGQPYGYPCHAPVSAPVVEYHSPNGSRIAHSESSSAGLLSNDNAYHYVGVSFGFGNGETDPGGALTNGEEFTTLAVDGSFLIQPNVFVAGEYHTRNFDTSGLSNLNHMNLRVGGRQHLTPAVSGLIEAGYTSFDIDSGAGDSIAGMDIGLGLVWQATTKTSVEARTGFLSLDDSDGFRISGSVAYSVTSSLDGTISYQSVSLDHDILDVETSLDGVTIGLRWHLN